MKRVFSLIGWVFSLIGWVFLSPFIAVSILAYVIAYAVVFGWKMAEDTLDDL